MAREQPRQEPLPDKLYAPTECGIGDYTYMQYPMLEARVPVVYYKSLDEYNKRGEVYTSGTVSKECITYRIFRMRVFIDRNFRYHVIWQRES